MSRDQLLKQIKSAQEMRVATKKICGEIDSRLAEIEDVKNQAHVAEANIPELNLRKQAFQADIALGKPVPQTDIDQVNAALTKATADVEEHTHTVAGLKSKQAAVVNDLRLIDESLLVLMREFIEKEAESLCGDYMAQAQTLLSTFRRLKALDGLSRGIGGNPFADAGVHKKLSIPVFNFACSAYSPEQQMGNSGLWGPVIELDNTMTGYVEKDMDAERSRFVSLGIII